MIADTVLGIDFGTKRIGLAISRSGSSLAFPLSVIQNSSTFLVDICQIITNENITVVVIGESLNLQGQDNLIMKEIRVLQQNLNSNNPQVEVFLEPEQYSSAQAKRFQGKNTMTDASAAAVILQTWLDRQKFSQTKTFDSDSDFDSE